MQERLPHNWFLTRLSNGLRILVVEDNRVPLATLQVAIRGGRTTQLGRNVGVPELLQQLVLRSADSLPGGLRPNAYAAQHGLEPIVALAPEHLAFGFRGHSGKLRAAAVLMRQTLRVPKFDTLELVQAKIRIAKQLQAHQMIPFRYMQEKAEAALWGEGLAMRKSTSPPFMLLREVALHDLKAYYRRYVVPNQLFVVVTGDVKHELCYHMLDSLFGDWKNPPYYTPDEVEFPRLERDTCLTMLHPQVPIPVLSLLWQVPDVLSSPKAYAVSRMLETLLKMRNGPLFEKLVNTGMAADVQAHYHPSQYVSGLQLTVFPYRDRLMPCVARTWQVLDSLRLPGAITQTHLDIAARLLLSEYHASQETGHLLASTVARMWATTGLSNLPEYVRRLSEITPDELRQFAERFVCRAPVVQAALLDYQGYELPGVKPGLSQVLRPGGASPVLAELRLRAGPPDALANTQPADAAPRFSSTLQDTAFAQPVNAHPLQQHPAQAALPTESGQLEYAQWATGSESESDPTFTKRFPTDTLPAILPLPTRVPAHLQTQAHADTSHASTPYTAESPSAIQAMAATVEPPGANLGSLPVSGLGEPEANLDTLAHARTLNMAEADSMSALTTTHVQDSLATNGTIIPRFPIARMLSMPPPRLHSDTAPPKIETLARSDLAFEELQSAAINDSILPKAQPTQQPDTSAYTTSQPDTNSEIADSASQPSISLGPIASLTIFFEPYQVALSEHAKPDLAEVSVFLANNVSASLYIDGHSDSGGTAAQQAMQSVQRAEAVRACLVEHYGVASKRLEARGFGSQFPLEPNSGIDGGARNRRVSFSLKP